MQDKNLWQGKTILICEDSKIVQEQLKVFYTSLQLNVLKPVSNGLEALAALEKTPADFVSLDIIMPKMQGIECFWKILDKFKKTKVFFVSCLNQPAIISTHIAPKLPPWLFLAKPPTTEEVQDVLKKLTTFENFEAEIKKYIDSLDQKEEVPVKSEQTRESSSSID